MSEIPKISPAVKPLQTLELAHGRQLSLAQPVVMGIVNVTPDSFSDGGSFLAVDHAIGHALKLIEEGAGIIDVGGESTRPGAQPTTAEEELHRVVPVIEGLRRQTSVPISVDTYKSEVARAALQAGADMINDISALRMDGQMAPVAVEFSAPVVLMHMLGTPETMQQNPHYQDCVQEIADFFAERIEFAVSCGIARKALILDPGIGFGKRPHDNVALLKHVGRFLTFGLPIMVGASRKGFIAAVTGLSRPAVDRLGGSLAAAVAAVLHGASIVRVHDVIETVEAVRVIQAIQEQP